MKRMELIVLNQDGVEHEYGGINVTTESDAVLGQYIRREFNRAKLDTEFDFLALRVEIV